MSDDDNTIQFPVRVIGEAGGIVDESRATLCIYGDDLDPAEVSAVLQVEPTRAHRKGDRRHPQSPAARKGAWLLSVEARAPEGPSDCLQELLAKVSPDPATWAKLHSEYEIRVSVGIFIEAWNRGFELPARVLEALALRSLNLDFDIYADDGSDE